jgi:sec-independent protein translocase protein TatA
MIGGLGAQELLLIFLAVLILFGAKRIPDIAQGLGKGLREFKSALRETQEEIKKSTDAVTDLDRPAGRKPVENETKKDNDPETKK